MEDRSGGTFLSIGEHTTAGSKACSAVGVVQGLQSLDSLTGGGDCCSRECLTSVDSGFGKVATVHT